MSRAARRFREVVERAIDRHVDRTPADDQLTIGEIEDVFRRIIRDRSAASLAAFSSSASLASTSAHRFGVDQWRGA